MGFKVQLKNNDAIFMTLDGPLDVKKSFMQAVENALKRRVIKFEINIAQNLSALEEIFLQLVALQRVLAKRGERLVLVSQVNIPAELESKLHEAGVELKVEQEIKSLLETPRPSQALFDELYKDARLKNWPKLENKFNETYEELKALIQHEKKLQSEIEFYKKRIVSLRPLIPDTLNLKELVAKTEVLEVQEQRMIELNRQNESLALEASRLSLDLQSKQAEYKALLKGLEASEAKKNQKVL